MASVTSQRRGKQHFSKIHGFSRGRTSFNADHSLVGGPGFSRVVFCNDPECLDANLLNYGGNYVQTTKYTLATFLPRSLFEQFRRVANVYFLLCAMMSFTPLSPFTPLSSVLPLVAVIALSMVKEIVEDWKRKRQDIKVNNRRIKVHSRDGNFHLLKWKDLKVGDTVKVEKDEYFPADLILISSSYDNAICYVETTNLDGESNLKRKQALDVTSNWQDDHSFQDFKAVIKCEDPNPNLYSFVGNLILEDQHHPLTPQQLLLRGSKLRNTDYIFGAVIFTGHDTKVVQNSILPPSKRSKIEKRTDKIVYLSFLLLLLISFIGSIFFGIATREDLVDGRMKRWYLRPDKTLSSYDPKQPSFAALLHFLTALMLYGYLIPISLYVSIEIVKGLQSIFINHDIHMYYAEADKPARARTSNLNEELGQVDTILSDKTGTLTCNSMEFVKCSVAGTPYGRGITEIQRALARRIRLHLDEEIVGEERNIHVAAKSRPTIKGFNFTDERIMNGNWVNEPHSNVIQKFLQLLALCHTAIPDRDKETGRISYEAESPDEAAFVIAARELGFEFYERTQTSISLLELDPMSYRKVHRSYTLLNILEFSGSRKRMSVILRDKEGKLILFSKGADSVMFERLSGNGREFEEKTKEHISEYADAGLRTLVLAYRELEEEEYVQFNEKFTVANDADQMEENEEVMESIEKDLILLGATAVEDKLQNGVPECIDKLSQAGLKIWVLTGDKMETAINIGFACGLLSRQMKQLTINSETPEIKVLEKAGDKFAVAEASKASVIHQINRGKALLDSSTECFEVLALIIDGKSLTYALEDDDVKEMFLDLAIECSSVICCRSSPKQKALVTRLVKMKTGLTTLAIGDGANDVGMLQEADIGVGISGAEGMQAVMASDVAIAQFRFLERLLLVHGHWCYRRICSMVCYFFYKNIAFGFTLFFYEAYTSFSGQSAYNDWYLSLYNVFFTSLPAIALGVFDLDVSLCHCMTFPRLYQEGVQNLLFCWPWILGWACNGLLSAVLIFFCCIYSTQNQVSHEGGAAIGYEILGTTMYSCVVCVVNCQMALSITYFTYIQHLFIWGSVAFYYVFLLSYGALDPKVSTSAYHVFVEMCAPDPLYWLVTLLVLALALLPSFCYSAIRMQFFPSYHVRNQQVIAEGRGQWQSKVIGL